MTAAVHTPITTDLASQVGPRLYRKQVLPLGSIDYKGRRLDFTRDYLASLVDAFKGRAYDSVKFLLAPADNSHTLDPERARGTVKGFELTNDGLDMLVEPTEDGAKVLDEHPDLGVSARIVEGLARADGKTFPRAIQHVLGTFDPRVTGMRPWQAVELSTEDRSLAVVDLTAESFTDEGKGSMPEITDEQKVLLDKLAAVPTDRLDALLTEVTQPDDEPKPKPGLLARLRGGTGSHRADDESEPTDDEITAAIAALEADANVSEAAGAALSAAQQAAAVDLANANAEQAVTTVTDLATQLAASQWREEKQILLSSGVPKAVLDAADPVLSLPAGAIDLSNSADGTPDPVETLRKVIDACKGIVDLSVIGETPDEDETAAAQRRQAASEYAKRAGITR